MDGACGAALRLYLAEVEAGKEPHPVFWSHVMCQGEQYPPRGHHAKMDARLSLTSDPEWPAWQRAESFYIPPHMQVVFHSFRRDDVPDTGTKTLNGEQLFVDVEGHLTFREETWDGYEGSNGTAQQTLVSAGGPFKLCFHGPKDVSDATDFCWGCVHQPGFTHVGGVASGECHPSTGNVITTGSIASMEFKRKHTFEEAIHRSCTGMQPMQIMGEPVARYQPHSETCDHFMETFCHDHPEQDECVCFVEELELERRFPDTRLAVRAFGPRCQWSTTAYQTQAMQDAPVNCHRDICNTRETWLDQGNHVECMRRIFSIPSKHECSTCYRLMPLWIVLGTLFLIFVALLTWWLAQRARH